MSTYFKVALRKLLADRVSTAVNLFGLTLASTCCTVLAVYLHGEFTYDRHHERHAEIFRVVSEFTTNDATETFAGTALPLGPMLQESYAEVRDYVRFLPAAGGATGAQSGLLLRHGADAYFWQRTYFVDANVFRVFTHRILHGAPETALVEPGTVAVSETFARRYFGDANPLGEIITTETGTPYRITLVFEDLPRSSHLRYDALFAAHGPFQVPDDVTARRRALWGASVYTYLVMPESYRPEDFLPISADFFRKNMADLGASMNAGWRSWLQPLADIHYRSTVRFDEPTGSLAQLYGLTAIGVFILLVASINYVNLATGRATVHARAVGIRKILGAPRRALIAELMCEAVLLAVAAAVVGAMIADLVVDMPVVEALFGKPLAFEPLEQPYFVVALLACSVGVGLLAGAYPALSLSSLGANGVLLRRKTPGKAGLRQALVLLQFTISIAVIAGTLLIASQVRFIGTKDVGFDTDNRIMVTLRGADLIGQAPVIAHELAANPSILGIASSANMLGQTIPTSIFNVENEQGVQQSMTVSFMGIDTEFLPVMGIRLVAGSNFSRERLAEAASTFLVNETFVRTIGWTDPVGRRINDGHVIGVVEDFNFKSLHTPVEPFVLTLLPDDLEGIPAHLRPFLQRTLIVNVAGEHLRETLDFIEATIARFDRSRPFEFRFLDDSLDALYRAERQLLGLTALFAAICIFIACLGLFGLASFTTDSRTKEIAVRKVSGAVPHQIIFLLSRPTLLMIVPAGVLGSAIAYLAVDAWLAAFAYRADIELGVFPLAAAAAAAVAYSTIALQSWRTVRRPPAAALRYE